MQPHFAKNLIFFFLFFFFCVQSMEWEIPRVKIE